MPPGISASDFYYILPELVLTAGALFVLIADVAIPRENRGALGWVTLLVIGATFVSFFWPIAFQRVHVEVAHGLLAVDRFALFFKIVFLFAAAITVLMSMRYLEIEGASPGEYYFLILCATLGMMIMAGIGFKIAAVPFHMWAPDVYEGAPTPITAFLSVGSKAASFAMLIRIFVEGLPAMSADWRLMFWALSIATMTIGNVAAVTQTNIKRMLAYSSVAHAGYVLMGIVAGTARGITATLVYLMIYSFMQLGAFAVVVVLRREDIAGDELKDFSGLAFRNPFAAFAMLLFMLSLGGIPPTAGFMGKFWLFSAAIDAQYYVLALIGVLNSAVSLYYYVRIVVFMYLKKESIGSTPATSPTLGLVLGVAGAATLILGGDPRLAFHVAE